MTDALADFCFAERHAFLVPAEAVGEGGLTDRFTEGLLASGRAGRGVAQGLSASIAAHWRRRAALARGAPDTFLPPRALNYLVVTDPSASRPYFEPFVGASALLYASDFATETGGRELGAYALCFTELLGQVGTPGKAALTSLCYLLSLEEGEVAELARDVARCARPDAPAFDLLCEHLGTVRSHVFCEGVNLPTPAPEGHARIQGTSLFAPRSMASTLGRIVRAFDVEARRVADEYLARAAVRTGSPESRLLEWLRADAPRVVVALGERVLWHPDRPAEVEALEAELGTIGDRVAESLEQDLRTVASASARMRALLREPEGMRVPTESIDEGGGVWLRHADAIVAYDLEQPGLDARTEPGPAYHGLLLAARTAHEWGHVAIENGVVYVADTDAYAEAKRDIERVIERIAVSADAAWSGELAAERSELAREGQDLGALPLARFEDYGANLLMRHALTPAELEAYVRNNVRPLGLVDTGPLRKLSRYAYEAQYLGLSGVDDPWDYFVRVTFFREEMIDSGLVSELDARALFASVGRALGAYGLNASKLSRELGALPRRIVA